MPTAFLETASHRCAILSGLDPDGLASKFGYYARSQSVSSAYPTVEDFSRGLSWLVEDDHWRTHGLAGNKFVKQTFETELAIERHIEIYKECLGIQSPPSQPTRQ